ncbi:TRAP transporter small permease [Mesobacillus foraminis]|uniref:TRAP transporter small permease n=1 Tax=Mesobacillus foraminis TaxID=279826 RepID=UPI000EF4D03B|nr:TRAP transporter small permease [Mesobacillus foraminis]
MKWLKWLDEHLEESILIVLSILTVVIVFTQVVMRYVLGGSLTWSEELARYLFIWMIYMGISYGVQKGKHLGVDAFPMMFEKKGKAVIEIIASLSFLLFAVVISYYVFDITLRVTRESAALELPMGWVYAAPVVGMGLTAVRLIQKIVLLVKDLKKGHEPEESIDLQEGII